MGIVSKKINSKTSPSEFADWLGLKYSAIANKNHKKENGQFFTPKEISSFMGSIASKPNTKNITILDPGCGTAVLTCSLVEKLIEFDINTIELIAYETDYKLISYTEQSLQYLKEWLNIKGIEFRYILIASDFIADMGIALKKHKNSFDYIISNPPYFKLSKNDKRVKLLQHLVKGQPNIYSLFMAVSVNLLRPSGELIFIVPRSFASGHYFNSFRNYFFKHINLNFVHLFNSRNKTFNRDNVLQETLILKGSKKNSDSVIISTSEGLKDLNKPVQKAYHISEIINLQSEEKILHLPTSEFEKNVMRLFRTWENRLIDFNIQVSTGPVVSFRSKEFLFKEYQSSVMHLAPLYWLHNVAKMNINWPLHTSNKEQYINIANESRKILLSNKNYVFLRRFSSKDDKSRLIAAPYFKDDNEIEFIGVENKLNYIYRINDELKKDEAIGIAALLNSKVFDTYFRTFNGNVNVSATEIRLMPFPPIESIREFGSYLISKNNYSQTTIDNYVSLWLVEQKADRVNE